MKLKQKDTSGGFMKKKVIILSIISLLTFMTWWSKFLFFVPHFQAGQNKTLVSTHAQLELVTESPEPEKEGINVPNFIPFWKTIGTVDGKAKGTLWEFDDKGKKYVLYSADGEMTWSYVYQYSKK
jgi:hypothetical protein